MSKAMPSEYIPTLWGLWDNKIVTEEQVRNALNIYGYELQTINPAGLIAENETVKYTYKSQESTNVTF